MERSGMHPRALKLRGWSRRQATLFCYYVHSL